MKKTSRSRSDAGFSLVELLVTLVVTTIVMGGALTAFLDATRINQLSTETVNTNRDLATAVDFIVRDLTQVAQGLPQAKAFTIPWGDNITVNRPAPPGSSLVIPEDTTTWPAVIPGPGLGPQVVADGPDTDVVTVVFSDVSFVTATGDPVPGTVAANGASVTIATPPASLAAGDVLMFRRDGRSAVQTVTSVSGSVATSQIAQFAVDDAFRFNQRTAPNGSIMDLRPATAAFQAEVTRLRIITYYVDAERDPPALMRCVNTQCVGSNATPGQVLALGVENFQVSYDLVDGDTNPSNVQMTAADLAAGGACGISACNEGQIRKVNLFLQIRSRRRVGDDFLRRSLSTQISLRNLSFMDKYPEN